MAQNKPNTAVAELLTDETDKKKKEKIRQKDGVRTKDVFGKKLGKTNIIVLLVLVCGIVFAGRYFILKSVDDKIADTNKQISDVQQQQARYLNEIKNQVQAKFKIDEISTSLPQQYSYSRVKTDVEDALYQAQAGKDLSDYILTASDLMDKCPIDGVSEHIKTVSLKLTVTLPDDSYCEKVIVALFNKTRIYYLDEVGISYSDAGNVTLTMTFYTFVETVEIPE